MNEADRLQALREQIDSLDRQIQTLIAERATAKKSKNFATLK